jgi:hypothetical protein
LLRRERDRRRRLCPRLSRHPPRRQLARNPRLEIRVASMLPRWRPWRLEYQGVQHGWRLPASRRDTLRSNRSLGGVRITYKQHPLSNVENSVPVIATPSNPSATVFPLRNVQMNRDPTLLHSLHQEYHYVPAFENGHGRWGDERSKGSDELTFVPHVRCLFSGDHDSRLRAARGDHVPCLYLSGTILSHDGYFKFRYCYSPSCSRCLGATKGPCRLEEQFR